MKKVIVILISILALLVWGVYLKGWREKGGVAYLEITGIMEATEVALSPKVSGRIEYLCCREGDEVKKGMVAIRLEASELMARVEEGRATLRVVDATLEATQSELEDLRAGVGGARAEVKTSETEISRIKTLLEDARKNLERATELFREGVLPEKDKDAIQTLYDSTQALLEGGYARRGVAEARLKATLAAFSGGESRVRASTAKVKEAEATLRMLESQLRDAEIVSPIDGVVAYKAYEVGEVVPVGASVYIIHDLKDMWARVDIEESKIGRIRAGGRAQVFVESLPEGFEGDVREIGRVGEFATQRDVTRGRADIRTFRVKVGIKEPKGLLKPGMTVRVFIVLSDQ
ncbi:MAG: efflux RND transporter periplasmic adaptor subunit [Deltaproteobacteria bacterium]|nr:efflux RND transporter periplasmic adaptor subunit [Deltaproteobacteria bacterium]